MSEETENQEPDDHSEDLFGTTEYEPAKPRKRNFLPWHRPRKQFVRSEQWCSEILDLLDLPGSAQGYINYFGLPGLDLLDLRFFHSRVCEPRKIQLRFLGFNSGAKPQHVDQTEFYVSLDEVRKLPRIDPLSDVIWDDFCLLANGESKAWEMTKGFGPYDIINLDLCDGFGKQAPGALDNTNYNAVARLMALQARSVRPWVLFLTTRTGISDINPGVLSAFLSNYAKNLKQCKDFASASLEWLGISDEPSLLAARALPEGHLSVYLTGICKWFIGIALAQQPPTKVELRSAIGYRVYWKAEHNDLVSLAFRFEPTFVAPVDPLLLAKSKNEAPSECTLATRALRRVYERACADTTLATNPELNAAMIEATASLLSLARYDKNEYYAWLRSL